MLLKMKYSKEKDTSKLSSLQRRKELEIIIEDQRKTKIYNQIWDKIKELINSVDGVNFEISDYFIIIIIIIIIISDYFSIIMVLLDLILMILYHYIL